MFPVVPVIGGNSLVAVASVVDPVGIHWSHWAGGPPVRRSIRIEVGTTMKSRTSNN